MPPVHKPMPKKVNVLVQHIDLVKVHKWAKEGLLEKTLEKISGKYDWTHIYYNYKCDAMQLILSDPEYSFQQEKDDLINSRTVTYEVDEDPIEYQVSKKYSLVLKVHRFKYKNEDKDFDPLSFEIEGELSTRGLNYYELIEIIED